MEDDFKRRVVEMTLFWKRANRARSRLRGFLIVREGDVRVQHDTNVVTYYNATQREPSAHGQAFAVDGGWTA